MYKNLMIDIETLDVAPENQAIVVSVGLVKFNLLDNETWERIKSDPSRTHYVVLPIEPQLAAGRTIGASTLLWWVNQIRTGHPDAATIFSPNMQGWDLETNEFDADLEEQMWDKLMEMRDFIDPGMYGWGKPAHFDLPKLDSVFRTFGMDFPIPWYMYRCMSSVRSAAKVFDIPKPKFGKVGNADHHALWDAIEQTLELQGWFRNMRP